MNAGERPCLLITIDTEGDNLWSRPREITTRNAAYLPRFQRLCERHGFKPTWLTNYEMACCPVFREFGRDVLQRGVAEIGMHLHAWNSPPVVPLTVDDLVRQPYLFEFPVTAMRDKIARLTDLLESTFERKMVSHRAGRWGLSAKYAQLLIESGYRVDCSVTPHVSWAAANGASGGCGGADFAGFPSEPYFLNMEQIDQPADSPLLELPMTIRPRRRGRLTAAVANLMTGCGLQVGRRVARYLWPTVTWLRPDGRNLEPMRTLLQQIQVERTPYAQFMLHSSELMPGGSPRFRTARRIEQLYDHLEQLFAAASEAFRGQTLSGFREEFAERRTGSKEARG